VPCPPLDHELGRYARWGEQLDVRNITRADGQAEELSAEQVAGYIAKYATKGTESFGSGLDRRLTVDDLERLDGLPAHVADSPSKGSRVVVLGKLQQRSGMTDSGSKWDSSK